MHDREVCGAWRGLAGARALRSTGSAWDEVRGRLENLRQCMERHRPAEQISLQNAAAAGDHSEGLTFGFLTFRDNREIERLRVVTNRTDCISHPQQMVAGITQIEDGYD